MIVKSRRLPQALIFAAVMLSACIVSGAQAAEAKQAQPAITAPAELPRTGIDATLSPDEIAARTAVAFYWGINIAGHYELRFVYTQLESHPAFRGINRLQPQYKLADATARYATTMNASTLYTGGAFDVSQEPVVIELDTVADGRYWSVQAGDQNANWFMMVGSQFTSNVAQRYLIVGPKWRGRFPPEFRSVEIIRATSNTFNIAGRVAVTDRSDSDLNGARKVIDGIKAGPLSLWEKSGRRIPPLAEQPIVKGSFRSFERMPKIVDYGRSMNAVDFLQLLSLSLNDPSFSRRTDSVKETATLQTLAALGVKEGALLDPALISPAQAAVAQKGFDQARVIARDAMQKTEIDMKGWKLQSSLFYDDLNYIAKAGADDVAWGTPVPYQSHTIGYLFTDSRGKVLDGGKRYTLTIDLKAPPPVTEFWELPVYDSAGYFIPNEINRNSVTSYQVAAGAFAVKSGKVTFYLQPDRPKDPEHARNWLPTKAGEPFQFAARFYGPKAPLIDGSFNMPHVVPGK